MVETYFASISRERIVTELVNTAARTPGDTGRMSCGR